jgi:mevalonate kinase
LKSTFFHANGKLLLSGEYVVLDGARSIGLPCKYGQSLEITTLDTEGFIYWESKTIDGDFWFDCTFRKADFSIIKTNDSKIAEVLQNILRQAKKLNPFFLDDDQALKIETGLEFPRLWGLGTSSTLIYNIAKWAGVDPFQLSEKTLGGSGYDIACAGSDSPLLYQLKEGKPSFNKITFDPNFKSKLYFIYLAKKQDSREGINRYKEKAKNNAANILEISKLTDEFLAANTLKDFQKIILAHEQIVSEAIEMPKAQDLYFSDFEGVVKSLGAWGGDFVLAATELPETKAKAYFNKKGFETFLGYEEMIRNDL